ncbi:transmembrane protein 145-like isoform X2 [Planococcus citri]|uniref:transmembrane protein 145-like isoform X2 n=1 Tax=Planococcus citri TaxID=170843 RepID=UPI0031F78A2E
MAVRIQNKKRCVLSKNYHNTKSGVISCHTTRRFHSARPRWWFLAISHCNATNGLNLKYKFLMTNGSPGELWKEHFSADEFYILPLLFTFFVMYILILLATIGCSIELKSRQLLHSTYKLFTLSVVFQEIGIILLCVAYIRYAIDGVGFPGIKTLGRMFESASEISFLLLLLLLAKGYTITRGRLRLASSVKLTIFMCAYVVTTLGLFIFEQHVFDPGEVLYLYESPAGYGLMILRVAAWWIFEYSTVFTLKHYPEKSNFYYPFNLMGTLWFIAGPCFTLIANSLIDKWIRESVVYGVCHFIAIIGHILFFLLTVPSKANKNFPYHVRTSQIGVMEMTGVSGNNSLYNFGHHPYAPYATPVSLMEAERSRICSPHVPVDLFSVHPSSTLVCKSTTEPVNNGDVEMLPQNSKNVTDTPVEITNDEPAQTPKMDQMNHFSSTAPCSATDRIFTVDRFIAPALRGNNRTLSA